MENMRLRHILVAITIFIGGQASAQFGIQVGTSMLRPFGAQKSLGGFHIGGEYSQDDETSYFGRITHHLGVQDPTRTTVVLQGLNSTVPYGETTYQSKTNYTILSGGMRYYIGDGYQDGFAAYGGTTLNLVFNSVKAVYDDYDQSKYTLPDGFSGKGSAVGFGVGLQGGVKYGILNFATVYFDVDLDYMIVYQPSNQLALDSRYLSNILFQFNLGLRKDIGWRD
jgi:hypothetical protein